MLNPTKKSKKIAAVILALFQYRLASDLLHMSIYSRYYKRKWSLIIYIPKYLILYRRLSITLYFYYAYPIVLFLEYSLSSHHIWYRLFLSESEHVLYRTFIRASLYNPKKSLTIIKCFSYGRTLYLASDQLYIAQNIIFHRVKESGFISEWKVAVPMLKSSQQFLFEYLESFLLTKEATIFGIRIIIIIYFKEFYYPQIYTLVGAKIHISSMYKPHVRISDMIGKAYTKFKYLYTQEYYNNHETNYLLIELLSLKA